MTNKQPVSEMKLGRITAAIWKNETAKGTFYNVSFSQLYKDDNQWKRTDSFGRDDLLTIAKLADLAHTRVYKLQTADSEDAASQETQNVA